MTFLNDPADTEAKMKGANHGLLLAKVKETYPEHIKALAASLSTMIGRARPLQKIVDTNLCFLDEVAGQGLTVAELGSLIDQLGFEQLTGAKVNVKSLYSALARARLSRFHNAATPSVVAPIATAGDAENISFPDTRSYQADIVRGQANACETDNVVGTLDGSIGRKEDDAASLISSDCEDLNSDHRASDHEDACRDEVCRWRSEHRQSFSIGHHGIDIATHLTNTGQTPPKEGEVEARPKEGTAAAINAAVGSAEAGDLYPSEARLSNDEFFRPSVSKGGDTYFTSPGSEEQVAASRKSSPLHSPLAKAVKILTRKEYDND